MNHQIPNFQINPQLPMNPIMNPMNFGIMNDVQHFSKLSKTWKILVIIGITAIVFTLLLIIFIILIFKTDMIPLEMFIDSKVDTDEYDDFFKKLDSDEEKTIEEKVSEFLDDDYEEDEGDEDITHIDVNYLLSKRPSLRVFKSRFQ